MVMKRDDCLKTLLRHRKGEILVAVYTAAQEITQYGSNDLNYTFVGAMGQASSHALGLALGRPDKRIVVLDGDGSLLMNLGTLVTIGNVAPKNLVHCVMENGTYETNGAVRIPGSGKFSFTAFAKTAGYAKTYEIASLDEWDRQLETILHEPGPLFVSLKTEPGAKYKEDFPRLYDLKYRAAFIKALKESR